MNSIKKHELPFIVFLTGACVLIVEVVATRILSPYYGNTIFTVSSVISIVLAALSAGYYFGGKLADKNPSEKIFYAIILASGLSVLILHILNLFLLPFFGYSLSIISGPLVSSIVLFFLPSVLLGMLSPFAIKLQGLRFPDQGIGSITGGIFFWSTLGSIFGSLSAGFFLIPQFGIDRIILTVAALLIILGLGPLLMIAGQKKSIFMAIIFVVIVIFLAGAFTPFKDKNIVYSHDGIYEKITVYDGNYGGRPVRFFQQDRSMSGAMFLDSDELVYDYTKYYSLYKVFNPDIKNALVIGGGAYSIPKALLKDFPEATVDVAEIEPSAFEIAKKYFKLEETDRLHNFTEDGRRLLHDSGKNYDFIFSDVYYSLFSIPTHFTTREFFKIAKDKLNNDGIFIANLIGDLSRQKDSLIMSEIKTFQTVFENSYFFAVGSPSNTGPQNIIFVGYDSDKKIDFGMPEIINSQNPIVRSLGKKIINLDRFEMSLYPILTDNFSPVEYLTSKLLQNSLESEELVNGKEMMALIDQQLRYGPRYLNAIGHENVQKFLLAEMNALTPETKTQTWQYAGQNGKEYELTNIIGRFFPENEKRIILATHYDSKKIADKDAQEPSLPVPGANDSASGVAVLLNIARVLNNSRITPAVGVDMVFFDGEEGEENQGGDYSDWKPLGSTYFAEHLRDIYGNKNPISALVLDMVCDKNLKISKERSSSKDAPDQVEAFWNIAKKINGNVFLDQVGPEIGDDHTPLNKAGIPSFLVIDFEYPAFHTTGDTLDKCSAQSLETVADAVLNYLQTLK